MKLRGWIGVGRPHILGIVFASTLVYGWVFSGRFDGVVPVLAVWDWFIVNFLNKATDTEEDAANQITGAAAVEVYAWRMHLAGALMVVLGLLAGVWVRPELLPWRVLFTLIGIAYNYRILPVSASVAPAISRFIRTQDTTVFGLQFRSLRFTRLKETYFFKNFGSSLLFSLSVFIYPFLGVEGATGYPLRSLFLGLLFFIPLELTYEIFYDLRDIEGDRRFSIPTYPVVHGPAIAKRILLGLLVLSALPLLAGLAFGWLRLREWCMVAAVFQQGLVYLRIAARDRLPTSRECISITWLGCAQLLSYALWVALGLPLGGG
jgi:4-hydroxybenzoate polyprenyltransferase